VGVRETRESDAGEVAELRLLLWPDDDGFDVEDESVLVWEHDDGSCGGFVSLSVRSWAEGCRAMPVAYVEGWFVREELRRRGIGAALMHAAQQWAIAQGFDELGSDVRVDNTLSMLVHRRLGFEPTERLQFFRKNLSTHVPAATAVVEP
jgi:aminoglycoside 6'-N-acetyltransferase I